MVIDWNVELFRVESAVTVPPPELASKVALSVVADGKQVQVVPPLVNDQCVVDELSHVPVPPIQ
jgi:hypothetical protein